MLWTVLSDYAGRIDCPGWCLLGTETRTPKCQACDLKASPSSRRVSTAPWVQAKMGE